MMFDGYDLVIYGSVLPHLMTEWNLSAGQAGMLGSSSILGMMVGALTLGTVADRFGRRPIILFCVALFSLAAFANAFAHNATTFALFRSLATLMLWLSFGMCMLMVYGLNTWLPKLMSSGGYPLGSSVMFLFVMNVGALIGQLASGVIADRWGCKPTLLVLFAVSAISISLLGIKPDAVTLYALLLLAGGATVGCLSLVHTLAADLYPANARSTGVSMAAAVGRCGAVAGPLLGGYLLSLSLPFSQNFLLFGLPGVLAVVSVLLITQRPVAASIEAVKV